MMVASIVPFALGFVFALAAFVAWVPVMIRESKRPLIRRPRSEAPVAHSAYVEVRADPRDRISHRKTRLALIVTTFLVWSVWATVAQPRSWRG